MYDIERCRLIVWQVYRAIKSAACCDLENDTRKSSYPMAFRQKLFSLSAKHL